MDMSVDLIKIIRRVILSVVCCAVPPQQVTMSGGSGRLMVDDAIRLTCLSSNGNPPANITWYNRSVRLPESRVTSSYRVSELGGFVTQSEVAVTMSGDKQNDVYTCQASNDIGRTVSTSITLSVLCGSPCLHTTVQCWSSG